MNKDKKKIIAIIGPTASGKTALGNFLAKKFNGEIVSVDSRQVFKGMDVGTGKDLDEYVVPYHMIDIVKPNTDYNLAKFCQHANKIIADILDRGKVPFLVGGTGLYMQALVDGYNLSDIKPDKELREKLEKMQVNELYNYFSKLNKQIALKLNESDRQNKRRLIRVIEKQTNKPLLLTCPPKRRKEGQGPVPRSLGEVGVVASLNNNYDFLVLGITYPTDKIRERIYARLIERLEKESMVEEVERLHKEGVSWKRLVSFGLEYKYISLHLQGKLDYSVMAEKLNIAIGQFAKKQMTWYRRWERQGRKIIWVKNESSAEGLIKEFIKKKIPLGH